jgi:hypothetical protein
VKRDAAAHAEISKPLDSNFCACGSSKETRAVRCRTCYYDRFQFDGPYWLNPHLVSRFWLLVEKRGPDECWPWKGHHSPPYGSVAIRVDRRITPAAAVSWSIANNQDFPAGMLACHSCDNPPCVNPAHVWPGTDKQNFDDCVSKGRWRGLAAENKAKTHCQHGHPFTGSNLIIRRSGDRACRECARTRTRLWMRQYYRRMRGEVS